ncbi:MAG: hypothetical protein EA390_08075 [Balneolaceae bacterium]|nr:MAG: hypothetical protein EA390_08075 [Balneolaceae bacterium]
MLLWAKVEGSHCASLRGIKEEPRYQQEPFRALFKVVPITGRCLHYAPETRRCSPVRDPFGAVDKTGLLLLMKAAF